jgi:hypothetical protein
MHRNSLLRNLSPLAALALAACASPGNQVPTHPTAFTLSAPQFADNAPLELRNAGDLQGSPNCVGQNVSPALTWKNVPPGTKSLAFIMHDPEGRNGGGVFHWVAYGVDPALGGFAEGEVARPSPKLTGGKSSQGLAYYMGPCPGANTGYHHYVLTAIATDYAPGELPPGLTGPQLLARFEGTHGRGASTIVLRFGRP